MIALALAPLLAATAAAETGFLDRTIQWGGAARRYQVYVPAGWTPKHSWPVVLFLHGAGESGDDGLAQTEVGLGAAVRMHAQRFPAVVVFPQCPVGSWWTSPGQDELALAALAAAEREFHGDPKRRYLAGISMGGYGAWKLAFEKPGFFAAVSPVCGGIVAEPRLGIPAAVEPKEGGDPYAALAAALGATPVWFFHGGDDPVVPTAESRRLAQALQGRATARYTELPGVGHQSWSAAYADPAWAAWLLAQRLP